MDFVLRPATLHPPRRKIAALSQYFQKFHNWDQTPTPQSPGLGSGHVVGSLDGIPAPSPGSLSTTLALRTWTLLLLEPSSLPFSQGHCSCPLYLSLSSSNVSRACCPLTSFCSHSGTSLTSSLSYPLSLLFLLRGLLLPDALS